MPPPNAAQCLLMKAKAGRVDFTHAKALIDAYNQIAAASPGTPDAQVALRAVDLLKRKIAKKKQQTAMQIMAANRVQDRLAQARSKGRGAGAAMMSMLDFDLQGKLSGENVAYRFKDVLGEAQALFVGGLDRFRTKILGLRQDKAGLNETVRAIFGENTQDASAKEIADAWGKVDEYLARRFNMAGGDLVQRQDWHLPQHHDWRSVGKAGVETWKQKVMPLLNRQKMIDEDTGLPFTDDRLDEVLSEVHETISTNGLNRLHPGAPFARSMANKHVDSRFLVFRDADSWLAYDKEFGSQGDIFSVMVGHMEHRAREIAFMEILGPNPEATRRVMRDLIRKDQPNKGGRSSVNDTFDMKQFDDLFDTLSGKTSIPELAWWADANQFMRNILASAQLGGAFISALSDINFQRLAAGYNGLPQVKTMGTALGDFLKMPFTQERTRMAARLGLTAEAWSSTALGQARFTGEVIGPRVSRRIADTVMRATFLTPWTQAGRQAFGMEFLHFAAQQAGRKLNELSPELQRTFRRYGISEADWDIARQTGRYTDNGVAFLRPSDIARAGHPKVAARIKQMVLTETDYAVPTVTARVRAQLNQGTQAGSISGELWRNVALYKSFPVTLVHTHLWRGMFGEGSAMTRGKYLANLIIGTTVMGAIAYQSKQMAAGKDPQSMDDPKFWLAAAVQGGGLGIFGDFLFADENRAGAGILGTAAGPVYGSFLPDLWSLTLGNLNEAARDKDTNAGREAARFLGRYTPGSSIWYTRLATERLLVDELQRMMDPRAHASFRQRRQFTRQRTGQDFWWAPGRTSPSRSPDLSEALE